MYWDKVSGSVAFEGRSNGARLLADTEAGKKPAFFFYGIHY